MTPAVGFNSLNMVTRPGASASVLADLSKRQQALSQKLAEASKTTPPSTSTLSADAIAREISGVQAQIEQIILEAQLSKLNASANSSGTASSDSAGPSGVAQGPVAPQEAPKDAVAKEGKPGKDAKAGTTGSTVHGAVASRASVAAAAHYGSSPLPASQLDEQV